MSHRPLDLSRELNQEQMQAVLHGDGPCLVLAGAGSGKTRTLIYRVAYLLEQGADPSSVLLLTFTNKSAKEMLQRVSLLLGEASRGIWGGTFHSIGSRLLRSFAEPLGFRSNFSILDSEDAKDLIKAVMKDLSIDPKAKRFPSASVVQNILSYARNTQTNVQEALTRKHPTFIPFVSEMEEIASQFQERKRAANVMDFDDLLSFLAIVLEDERFGPHIAERFHHVLVDEYQDTNALQARVVRGFGQVHRQVMVVGDDAQSIYAFRGADVRNILSFPREWPNAKILKLVTNYRSTPEILDLANDSLSHNRTQFEKTLTPVRDHGSKPKRVVCASAGQEAVYIAEQLLALRQKGTALQNMAVLFRSSSHSQQLEFELIKRDIPYEYRGGIKFFERAHIKDVLAHLRVAHNPNDEIAWLRVLGLQPGIGATTASAMAVQARNATSLPELLDGGNVALVIPTRAQEGWGAFSSVASVVLAAAPSPSMMIRAILQSSYRDALEREYPNWRERLDDLEQLAAFAEGYDDLTAFLNDIALYDEVMARRNREMSGTTADVDERVVLSTIHQAKGLEWDTVFIIHLADNAFPNRRALTEEGGMEEERRLFYVAVTRARRSIFLTYPMTMGTESLIFNASSVFLEEVSPRLFERVEWRADTHGRPPSTRKSTSWSWESGEYEEPVIHRDEPEVVWKALPSANLSNKPRPGSFLKDV